MGPWLCAVQGPGEGNGSGAAVGELVGCEEGLERGSAPNGDVLDPPGAGDAGGLTLPPCCGLQEACSPRYTHTFARQIWPLGKGRVCGYCSGFTRAASRTFATVSVFWDVRHALFGGITFALKAGH